MIICTVHNYVNANWPQNLLDLKGFPQISKMLFSTFFYSQSAAIILVC